MPKSSSASVTPSCFRSSRTTSARWRPGRRRSRSPPGSPAAGRCRFRRALGDAAAKSGDMSWWADTLTDIVRSSVWRRRCQRWRSGKARSRTHRPMSVMRPDCSARGTSTVGITRPRDGVRPAHERLDAGDPPVRWCRRSAGTRRELAPRRPRRAGRVPGWRVVGEVLLAQVDDLVAGAALALRLVHRGVGVLQELLGELVAPTGEGDPDAGRDLQPRRRAGRRAPATAAQIRAAMTSTRPARRGPRTGSRTRRRTCGRGCRPDRSAAVRRWATAMSSASPTLCP